MSLLYQPSGRANEYAEWALNVYKGCSHGCVYCYAAGMAARFGQATREEFHQNVTIKKTFSLDQLKREAKRLAPKINSRVLLSFSTDPYQPIESTLHLTRQCIEILHAEGINVQILTKDPLRAMMLDRNILTGRDALATTLTLHTTKNPTTWRTPTILEPGAPMYEDRVTGIKIAHKAYIPTWVSLEPVIYPADSLNIIRETFEIVDHYKVGTLNYDYLIPEGHNPHTTPKEWHVFYENVTALLEALGFTRTNARNPEPKTYQIKESLQKYAEGE